MRSHYLAIFMCASLCTFSCTFAQAQQRVPVQVVELFTSQGCSACPPADALLGTLMQDDPVLPLSFHVDYWNYLGWEDPLSTPFATARQRAYRDALSNMYIYTPQFMVGGAQDYDLREHETLRADLTTPLSPGLALAWTQAGLTLEPIEGGLEKGSIWLVHFYKRQETDVKAGKNKGLTLTHYHSVYALEPLGDWTGTPQTLALNAPETYGLAVLVSDAQGRIHGAADWRLETP